MAWVEYCVKYWFFCHHNFNEIMFTRGCPRTTCQACVTLTFDLDPTWTNVSNGTSTHDGEQLGKFLLKSIQNCMSYGLDKNLTFKCDFDLGLIWRNISNGTSTHDEEHLCQIIRSYGPDKFGLTDRCTHPCTNTHLNVIVTTMSRPLQAGSTKSTGPWRHVLLQWLKILNQVRSFRENDF